MNFIEGKKDDLSKKEAMQKEIEDLKQKNPFSVKLRKKLKRGPKYGNLR